MSSAASSGLFATASSRAAASFGALSVRSWQVAISDQSVGSSGSPAVARISGARASSCRPRRASISPRRRCAPARLASSARPASCSGTASRSRPAKASVSARPKCASASLGRARRRCLKAWSASWISPRARRTLAELAVGVRRIARAAGGLFQVLRRGLQLAGLGEEHAEIEVGVGERGIEGERREQLLARVARPAEGHERARVVEVRLGERRADGERLLQRALRLAQRVEEQVREPEGAQRLDVARAQVVGALQRVDGLLVAAELQVEAPEPVAEAGLLRRERGGLGEGLLREIELAERLPRHRELEEGLRRLGRHRREPHRLLQLDDGLRVTLQLREELPVQRVRRGLVRAAADGLLHVGERVLALAELEAAVGQPEERLGVVAVDARGREQRGHGRGVLAQLAQRGAQARAARRRALDPR